MVNIIVDTGFWRALCDPDDAYYDASLEIHDKFFGRNGYRVLIPYPSMYELINTKFVKNKTQLKQLDKEIADSNSITKVYDEKPAAPVKENQNEQVSQNINNHFLWMGSINHF